MSEPVRRQSRAVEQVEQEHEELRELIGAIHKSLANTSSPTSLVKEQLAALCDKLEIHFRSEEKDGFFTEITEHAPRFSDQADKLTKEHDTMLAEAKAIAAKAIQCTDSIGLHQDVRPAFHELSKHLMHHESEEHDMLHQAYWEDIGPAD